jgi:hypothetical protein
VANITTFAEVIIESAVRARYRRFTHYLNAFPKTLQAHTSVTTGNKRLQVLLTHLNDASLRFSTLSNMLCDRDTDGFRNFHLTPSQIDQAYTLIREIRSDLTLELWRNYVRPLTKTEPSKNRNRGMLVTEYRGYLRGLVSYDASGKNQKTLEVRDVVIPLLPDGRRAARSLLQELFVITQSRSCEKITVGLTSSMDWLAREWSDPNARLYRAPVTCVFHVSSDRSFRFSNKQPNRPNLRLVINNQRQTNQRI